MLLLLPILLQLQVVSEKRPTSIRVDSAEFPVWADFTRCLSDGMKSMPDAVEERSPKYEVISKKCRNTVEESILESRYKGISSKPENRSHRNVLAMLDGTDQHMRTIYLRMPDVKKVNARIEKMGLGVIVYDPIAHLYEEYSECVSRKYNEASFRHFPSERAAGWQAAIKSCVALKASLKLDAEPITANLPDFQDSAKRKSAIYATFDGHDEMVVKAASVEWAEPE
jgi:hypothetical protein